MLSTLILDRCKCCSIADERSGLIVTVSHATAQARATRAKQLQQTRGTSICSPRPQLQLQRPDKPRPHHPTVSKLSELPAQSGTLQTSQRPKLMVSLPRQSHRNLSQMQTVRPSIQLSTTRTTSWAYSANLSPAHPAQPALYTRLNPDVHRTSILRLLQRQRAAPAPLREQCPLAPRLRLRTYSARS